MTHDPMPVEPPVHAPRASALALVSLPAASGAIPARRHLARAAAVAATFGAMLMQSGAMADEVKGDVQRAAGKVSMCIGCHGIEGYRASFPAVYNVPFIAGQSPKYIESALNAYRKGDRSHPTMRGIAGSLSDEDIADLAAYYGRPRDAK